MVLVRGVEVCPPHSLHMIKPEFDNIRSVRSVRTGHDPRPQSHACRVCAFLHVLSDSFVKVFPFRRWIFSRVPWSWVFSRTWIALCFPRWRTSAWSLRGLRIITCRTWRSTSRWSTRRRRLMVGSPVLGPRISSSRFLKEDPLLPMLLLPAPKSTVPK